MALLGNILQETNSAICCLYELSLSTAVFLIKTNNGSFCHFESEMISSQHHSAESSVWVLPRKEQRSKVWQEFFIHAEDNGGGGWALLQHRTRLFITILTTRYWVMTHSICCALKDPICWENPTVNIIIETPTTLLFILLEINRLIID